jgi:hypothetical protein
MYCSAPSYLLLGSPSSALGELAVVVHGGSSTSGGLPALPSLGVQHPPRALPCPLVLHTNKTTVEGQVVADGILEGRREFGFNIIIDIANNTIQALLQHFRIQSILK